jgi:hypothetical protein
MTEKKIPSGAKSLLGQLDGWSTYTHAGAGTCEFSEYGESRGDGTRPLVKVSEDVDSYLVRAAHVDGRVFVAIWVSRRSRPTKSGGRSWTLDTAWRGRAPGELAPRQITATQLTAYVTLERRAA